MPMKLTKGRIDKLFNKENKKILTHTHTFRRKKPFNLKNTTLRKWY